MAIACNYARLGVIKYLLQAGAFKEKDFTYFGLGIRDDSNHLKILRTIIPHIFSPVGISNLLDGEFNAGNLSTIKYIVYYYDIGGKDIIEEGLTKKLRNKKVIKYVNMSSQQRKELNQRFYRTVAIADFLKKL